jgi:predicted TIM-barrel fold metal-dependent hydrolase
MIIDTHLHVWSQDVKKYPWNPIGGYIPEKSASIAEFIRQMDDAFVEKAVLVQPTPYGWDNSYLLDICREAQERFKAVVLVDPSSDHASESLKMLVENGACGLRVNLPLLTLESIRSDTFLNLLNTAQSLSIPVCFQLTPEYFNLISGLFNQFKGTQFILDHLARPNKGCKLDDENFMQMLEFSKNLNVFVKLSGLNYFSNQSDPYEDTWSLLKAVNDRFTADHCMWGSDFPFVNEHWSYLGNLNTFKNDLGFSDPDLVWILGKTADAIWWGE